MVEKVVLVNEKDEVTGTMEKMEAHKKGLLHRAFSVFIFNESGEMLLQKRSGKKYHSPNLWTNACCSHPHENETCMAAAERRLMEEIGIDCRLQDRFSFIYKADVGKGLTEHELDHVFTGNFTGSFHLNPDEVSEVKYLSIDELKDDMKKNPQNYTQWFKIILNEFFDKIGK